MGDIEFKNYQKLFFMRYDDYLKNLDIFCYFSPLIVSMSENETEEEFDLRWERFDSLPEVFKEKLSNEKIPEVIKQISDENNLELFQIAFISRLIRSYYFGEIKESNFPDFLVKFAKINPDLARLVSRRIINEIISRDFSSEERIVARKITEVSLDNLLQNFPGIGEQLVTSSPIKLKLFPQPVRPSVKNWIEDYRQAMGIQKHGMMERGNYLFHGENGKKLTSGERKKLAEILRSLDEDVTLKVDPERQEIVFDQLESSQANQEKRPEANVQQNIKPEKEIVNKSFERFASEYQEKNLQNIPSSETKKPNSNIRFSSPHIMQSERASENPISQSPRQNIAPEKPKVQRFQSPAPVTQQNFSNIQRPKNVSQYQSNAGKPFVDDDSLLPSSVEPKISGNTVDLRSQ